MGRCFSVHYDKPNFVPLDYARGGNHLSSPVIANRIMFVEAPRLGPFDFSQGLRSGLQQAAASELFP